MSTVIVRLLALGLVIGTLAYGAPPQAVPSVFGGRSILDAHNAYPEEGQYQDRLTRAMSTGLAPLGIEQDVAYQPRSRQVVVSHDTTLDGTEPTLEQHFFARLKPLLDSAVAVNARQRWPLFVLHLDFKTNERELHRAVWDVLDKHRAWLMTAPAAGGQDSVTAFTPGPLLVLTENGTGQEKDFTEFAAASGSYLLFGTIPAPARLSNVSDEERSTLMATLRPDQLIVTGATSYRRWVNFPWAVIERGGQVNAGEWSADDRTRLERIATYAHQQGLLIRFYTLNGHDAAASRGWSAGYNFGSLDAVRQRWRAAIDAHVDLIATDQYEEFAAILRGTTQPQ